MEECDYLPSEDVQNIREFEESLGQSTSLSFNDIANKLLTLSVITTEEYQKVETENEAKKFELIFNILMDKEPHLHSLARKIDEYKDKVSRMEKQQVVQTTQTTAHSDESRYLSNADVSEDWELKLLLMKIAEDLDSTDYKKIVHLVKGEIGFDETILEHFSEASDLFSHLMKMRIISRFNLLYLEALIWHIDRKDLVIKLAEFAQDNDKEPLYFFMPSEKPANGYRYVNVYIGGNICSLTNEEKEKQRYQLSKLLHIPLKFVFLNGIQSSNSILLTFMVPEISIDIFKSLKPTIEGISVEFVDDILTIREIPLEKQEPKDEETEWEKQVKNLMEKENKLKQKLNLSLTQLLETEKQLHVLEQQIKLQTEEEPKDEKTDWEKHLKNIMMSRNFVEDKLLQSFRKLCFQEKQILLETEEEISTEKREPQYEKIQWKQNLKDIMKRKKDIEKMLLKLFEDLFFQEKQILLETEKSMLKEIFKGKQEPKYEKIQWEEHLKDFMMRRNVLKQELLQIFRELCFQEILLEKSMYKEISVGKQEPKYETTEWNHLKDFMMRRNFVEDELLQSFSNICFKEKQKLLRTERETSKGKPEPKYETTEWKHLKDDMMRRNFVEDELLQSFRKLYFQQKHTLLRTEKEISKEKPKPKYEKIEWEKHLKDFMIKRNELKQELLQILRDLCFGEIQKLLVTEKKISMGEPEPKDENIEWENHLNDFMMRRNDVEDKLQSFRKLYIQEMQKLLETEEEPKDEKTDFENEYVEDEQLESFKKIYFEEKQKMLQESTYQD